MRRLRTLGASLIAVGTIAAAVLAIEVVLFAPEGLAAWSAGGTGTGAARAATMPTGGQPAGSATGAAVTIRWTAVALSNGVPVAGYVINRFDAASGAQATVGVGCSGVLTTTTCTEQSVPAGTWIYTVTPVQLGWTGGQSPGSAPIVAT